MASPPAPRGPVARASAFLLNQGSALVGGQAVLEGVLMRIPAAYAVAVRTPKGEIRVKRDLLPETARGRFGNLPLVRGSVILFKALMLGISALNFSAEVAIEEGEPEGEVAPKPAKKDAKTSFALAMTVVFSLAVGVALFFYVPLLLTQLAGKYWEVARGTFGFNLVDGAIRVVIFLAYIVLISCLKDIRRVFAYHGAEHKVVHTWEAKEELVVENARKFSVLHPRCGTSFLLFVMVISILVFSLVPHPTLLLSMLTYSLAVGFSIFTMVVTDTEHPPASGTALGVAITGMTPRVLIAVVLSIVLLSLIHRFFKPHLRDLT